MNPATRVFKNSIFLIAQPLALNIISLFVIGYMARVLGAEEYGIFLYAFSFVALFSPLAHMGLRAVTVREVASVREHAASYMGRVLTLRVLLIMAAIGVMAVVLELSGLPDLTKKVCYVASIAFLFDSLSAIFGDGLEAFERMNLVALCRAVAGLVLTALTVILLMLGLGVLEVSLAYALGSLFGLLLYFRFFRQLSTVRLKIDVSFWREALKAAGPFFVTGVLGTVIFKIDIVALFWLSGDKAVAIYGAAAIFFYRLALIPDSVSTSFFPATAALLRTSPEEVHRLFQRAFSLLLFVSLPLATGLSLAAAPLIKLIYGSQYQDSIEILRVLSWAVPPFFLATLCGSCLGAVRLQGKLAKTVAITAAVSVLANIILIYALGALGAALALVLTHLVHFIFILFMVCRHFASPLENGFLAKVALTTLAMASVVFFLKDENLFLIIGVAVAVYSGLTVLFRTVTIEELVALYHGLRQSGLRAGRVIK